MFTSQSLSLAAGISGFAPAPSEYEFQLSEKHGFLYYQITKCGCTFTKALINALDGRAATAEPIKTFWAGGPETAFVIIRHPVDRFMSFYFDKVLGHDTHICKKFTRLNLINPQPTVDTDHQRNCAQVLGWINSTLNGGSRDKPNFHWRPQIYRLHKISKLNVHMLTLDGLKNQLPMILADCCPNIAKNMQVTGNRNVSYKPIDPNILLDQKLRKQISRIYAADERVYSEVNRHWAQKISGRVENGQDIKQTARGWLVADRQACWNHFERGCEQGQVGA